MTNEKYQEKYHEAIKHLSGGNPNINISKNYLDEYMAERYNINNDQISFRCKMCQADNITDDNVCEYCGYSKLIILDDKKYIQWIAPNEQEVITEEKELLRRAKEYFSTDDRLIKSLRTIQPDKTAREFETLETTIFEDFLMFLIIVGFVFIIGFFTLSFLF